MSYVVDTHSLIWFLTSDNKLGKKASELLRNADEGKEEIIIPTIVLAEILYICEKKKAEIGFREILERIKDRSNFIIYDLNLEVILKLIEITKIHELHDRIIIATAILTGSDILTKDKVIKDSSYVEAIW